MGLMILKTANTTSVIVHFTLYVLKEPNRRNFIVIEHQLYL